MLTRRDKRLEASEMRIWRKMRSAGLIVTKLNSIWQRRHRRIGHVLRHDGLLHKITEGRMTRNLKEGGEEIKCYMIWQMMVTMLH